MTATIAQTLTSRIGRSTIGVAVSVAILGVAGYTLYELLRGIEFDKVLAAIAAQSGSKLVIAGAFVIAAYVALTHHGVYEGLLRSQLGARAVIRELLRESRERVSGGAPDAGPE